MSVDTLVSRIIESNKFKFNYNNLLVQSVRSQIPNIETADNANLEIDW